jgi:hypothetical protein
MLRRGGELNGERILGPHPGADEGRSYLRAAKASSTMAVGAFSERPTMGSGSGSVCDDARGGRSRDARRRLLLGRRRLTIFWVDPKEDPCVVFMTQLMPSATFNFRGQLKNIIYSR